MRPFTKLAAEALQKLADPSDPLEAVLYRHDRRFDPSAPVPRAYREAADDLRRRQSSTRTMFDPTGRGGSLASPEQMRAYQQQMNAPTRAAPAAHSPSPAAHAPAPAAKPGLMARLRGMFGKKAFALTPEGHEQDAEHYRTLADFYDQYQDANKAYAKKAPIRSLLSLDPIGNLTAELVKRHLAYAADKHEAGENAYNPYGGLLTPYRRKEAFAVTDEGHEYDAEVHRRAADALARIQAANEKYRNKAKLRGLLSLDPLSEVNIELAKRHNAYASKKHERGENAYNPFGGMATPYPEE
jgi:hypothetical protein